MFTFLLEILGLTKDRSSHIARLACNPTRNNPAASAGKSMRSVAKRLSSGKAGVPVPFRVLPNNVRNASCPKTGILNSGSRNARGV